MSETTQKNQSDGSGSPPGLPGIPRGNTIAIVGDPGTGKTTFLLTYLTQAKVVTSDRSDPPGAGLVRLQQDDAPKEAAMSGDNLKETTVSGVGAQLDDLFRPACRIVNGDPQKTLRCFVSLENSLPRVLQNHGRMFEKWTKNDAENEKDDLIFVDATAFLSGRLEDRLRYPRLEGTSKQNSQATWGVDCVHDLSLGGHNREDDQHFGLYFQWDNNEPKRIEQLEDGDPPFHRDQDGNPISHRAFNLMTRPLPDPLQRVRLLKDLLAEIFVRFSGPDGYEHRLLAIDSLSALLNPFGEQDVSASASPARRLHILNLVRWLEEYGVTTFLACEAEHDSGGTLGGRPLFLGTEERYLTSGVIQLHYHDYPSGDMVRYLRVLKMRGAGHDMRPHAYDLDKQGIAWLEPLVGEVGTRS